MSRQERALRAVKFFRDRSKLVTLYGAGEVSFPLIGTKGFHVEVENKRFTASGLRCYQKIKFEN